MENEKNLIEFLEILVKLTQDNIDFINEKEILRPIIQEKYFEELKQIRNLINSFDFVRNIRQGNVN